MARAFILYNPLAGKGDNTEKVRELAHTITDEMVYCDVTAEDTYAQYLSQMAPTDYVVVCGGDGTLNRFVNAIQPETFPYDILYYPCGSGNDFARDIGIKDTKVPISVKEYLQNLPTTTVKGQTYRFVNGIGFGLDGFCNEEANRLRDKSNGKTNYIWIALKGLLYMYKPTNATVTVDGVTRTYKKVWLVSNMYGRFYGGGMQPAPAQRRGNGELTVMVAHDLNKLTILALFPSILKGKHVRFTKHVDMLTCKEVSVTFDRAAPVQLDGEPISDVHTLTARADTAKYETFTEKEACAAAK